MLREAGVERKVFSALAISAIAIVMAAFAYGTVVAEEKKKAEPACRTVKDESACKAREDCSWVAAVIDPKTQKQKRRAYCRAKPKSKKK
jgi:hypothetical protein